MRCRGFNYLIGAPDAHAKNYSVLLLGDVVRLAPLYDVASGLPYERHHLPGLRASAMAIGGERVFGEVGRRHIERFAAEARLDAARLIERPRHLAAAIPDAVSDALSDPSVRDRASDLSARLVDPVSAFAHAPSGSWTSRERGDEADSLDRCGAPAHGLQTRE